MADKTKQEQRGLIYDHVKSMLPDVPSADVEKLVDTLIGTGILVSKTMAATKTKTFRFPIDLLDWLEAKAADNSRSPNAELIELLRNAKAGA